MSEIKPLARREEIVVQELDEEILVYDLKTNRAMALNQTVSMVWEYCDGKKTIKDIAEKMTINLKAFVSKDLVLMSLEQLKKKNLIEIESVQAALFEGLSRREMVRKVGLASIIALPIISSLVAPSAVNAQSFCPGSGRPNGCACSANSNCASNCCATTPSGNSPTGNTCIAAPGTEPPGSTCRGNCECASNSCPPAPGGSPRVCV